MQEIRNAVDRVLEWLVIALMGLNVINVLWQVFTRFVLKNPSSFTEELARYLLIWVGLLGAAYAVSKRMHLAIDVFTERLQGRRKLLSELFIQLCIFSFALFVMVIGGLNLVQITFKLQQISAALQIKIGYVYSVIPLSGVLIMFYSALLFVENFQKLIRGDSTVAADRRTPAVE